MPPRGNPSRPNPILGLFKDMIHYGLEAFGRYYSSYRGIVFDNADPLNLQRVQLLIPEIAADHPLQYWAIPKGVFSGPGYGSQVIPQKGDVVWVEFEGGHPEVPIYSLGHFGNDEIPTNRSGLKDPNCYWFMTPYGHIIRVNDTEKYISIETAKGHFIDLRDEEKILQLKTTDGHEVILNDKDNLIKITHKGGQYTEINDTAISLVSDKKISSGSLNTSAQKAMLGDITKDLLSQIKAYLELLTLSLTQDSVTLTPYAPNTILAIPDFTQRVALITEKLEEILSSKNTLD